MDQCFKANSFNFTNTSNVATGTLNYDWDFGDGTTSTDTNPWHTFTSAGQYDVMLVAMNAGCDNDTTYITVDVGTIGLEQLDDVVLSVVPNPFTKEFVVHSTKEIEKIELIDSRGAFVTISWLMKDGTILIDASRLSKGVYILQLNVGDEIIRKRIVKN